MNEAIKLAIEKGGYEIDNIKPFSKVTVGQDPVIKQRYNVQEHNGCWEWTHKNDLVSDPLFWQALGKALGWDEQGEPGEYDFKTTCLGYAHEYFDLVLTGGDTDKSLNVLPERRKKSMPNGAWLETHKENGCWSAKYVGTNRAQDQDLSIFPRMSADTEADARAKMLIHLLENNLITL
jgi:hypothetical protein